MIVIYFFAKKHGYRSKTSFTFKEAIHTILQAIPALLLIIIVIGGIIGGGVHRNRRFRCGRCIQPAALPVWL